MNTPILMSGGTWTHLGSSFFTHLCNFLFFNNDNIFMKLICKYLTSKSAFPVSTAKWNTNTPEIQSFWRVCWRRLATVHIKQPNRAAIETCWPERRLRCLGISSKRRPKMWPSKITSRYSLKAETSKWTETSRVRPAQEKARLSVNRVFQNSLSTLQSLDLAGTKALWDQCQPNNLGNVLCLD